MVRLFVFLLLFAPSVLALEDPGEMQKRVGLIQNLGKQVDMGLTFTDANGRTASLREFALPGKPIIFVPVYYGCPRLCNLVLTGFSNLLNALQLKLGQDYSVLTVSFDTSETAADAKRKADQYFAHLKQAELAPGSWHFLVGPESQVHPIMEQVGFKYAPDKDEWAHTATIVILTSDGKISQYFPGIEFPAWDTKLALVEASQGGIGSLLDHALLFCFRFDYTKGRYTWVAWNFTRVFASLGAILVGVLIYRLWKNESAVEPKTPVLRIR